MRLTYLICCFFLSFVMSCGKVSKEYFPNGTIKSEKSFRNGQLHGVSTHYYPNGNKQLECRYVKGKLHGSFQRWYFNGNTELIQNYIMDTLDGTHTEYFENGQVKLVLHYSMGKHNGNYVEFHSNGQKKVEGQFSNNMYEGQWNYYDAFGVHIGKGDYVSGKGTHVSFFYNTTDTMVFSHYVDNKKHGREIWYNADGTIKNEKYFEHGSLVVKQEE